ncbi:MAG: hypothetical protein QHJ81_06100 [Anaerolineae bacterium]|nr:hypothetical protein [Anaerolineae bacterium]
MESTALTVKFVLLLALEVFVVATVGAVLILGLYRMVREKARRSLHLDEVAAGSSPAAPASVPGIHQS